MKEYKFRAWDEGLKEMLYFGLWNIDYNVDITIYNEDDIMQYTGLKDINGSEIYEGDIVKNPSEEGYPMRGLVFYNDGSFKVTSSHADITDKKVYDILDKNLIEDNNMEKIGNKYENPELME